jgi:hypothetical protein
MELANAERIANLLGQSPARERPRTQCTTAANSRNRRCQCGKCSRCQENARWERIFAQKFADPYYYTLRAPRAASPLTSL